MKSRYLPLTQQRYCCVPTCIQMVMYKNSIPLVSQEDLGNALGLVVPKEDAYLFENTHEGEKPKAGWGTQIYIEEFSPNRAFQNLGIPLKLELHLIDGFATVDDVAQFLVLHQKSDSDLLVCYSYGELFDTQSNSGHVNVFDSIDAANGTVTLIDPEQTVPKYRKVSIEKLFSALIAHGSDNSGGFWQLLRTN